jgi:hypothetical protein
MKNFRTILLEFGLFVLLAATAAAESRLVAFSLGEAQRQLLGSASPAPEVAHLGGITQIIGMVYDADTGDPILIGRTDESAPPLDLDSLVTAFRAVLALKQYPLVSIDATPDTETTGKQTVRLEGGIADSRFGLDFVSADVRLKRLGLGLDHAAGIESYFDLRRKLLVRAGVRAEGSSRFWFYPVDPGLEERDDVFLIRSLVLGVRAQVISSSAGVAGEDSAADAFADQLSAAFPRLAVLYPEIARLQSLCQMVAVARGLEMTPGSAYAWWLKGYVPAMIPTPRQFDVIRRDEQVETPGGHATFAVSGGIQFRSLTVRLIDGDATALKEAVLLSRPVGDRLSWEVPLDASLLVPGAPTSASVAAPAGDDCPGSTLAWKLGSGPGGFKPPPNTTFKFNPFVPAIVDQDSRKPPPFATNKPLSPPRGQPAVLGGDKPQQQKAPAASPHPVSSRPPAAKPGGVKAEITIKNSDFVTPK